MPDLNDLLNSEHAKKLIQDQSTVSHLKNAPESQRLLELLAQKTDGNLDQMANAAVQGDPKQLMGAIQELLRDPKSKKLLNEISQSIQF